MSFCTQCGRRLKVGANFCTNCGNRNAKKETYQSRIERKSQKVKFKWNKKHKLITLSIFGLLSILLASYMLVNFFTDKERTISAFEKAVQEEDAKELAAILSTANEELEINEQTVEPLLTWLSENPIELDNIVQDLKEQAEMLDDKGAIPVFSKSDANSSIVSFKEDGKIMGLFDRYSLEIAPAYVELSAPYKNTTFYYKENELGAIQQESGVIKVGPYIPGSYTFKAKLEAEYVDLEKEEQVELVSGNNNYIYFDLEADEVIISTDLGQLQTESQLLVNGEPIEWNLQESKSFGPVLLDGSLTMALKITFPWGEIQTDEQTVERNNLFFSVKQDDEIKNTVVDLSEKALTSYLYVKANYSTDGLENLTNETRQSLLSMVEVDQDKSRWKSTTPLYFEIFPELYNLYQEDGTFMITTLARLTEEVEFKDSVEERSKLFNLRFAYSEEDEEWKITMIEESNTYLFDTPEEHVFSPNQTYENKGFQEELSDADISLIENTYSQYLYKLVEAINQNNFDLIKGFLKKDSELFKAQQKLVKELSKKGIKENVIFYEIENITREGKTISFDTYEMINIRYPNGSFEIKEYEWTYNAELINGDVKLIAIK